MEKTREEIIDAVLDGNMMRKSVTTKKAVNATLDIIENEAFREILSEDIAERVASLNEEAENLRNRCESLEAQLISCTEKLAKTKEFMDTFTDFHKNLIDSMDKSQRSAISAYTYMVSLAYATHINDAKQAIMKTASEYFMATLTGKNEGSK